MIAPSGLRALVHPLTDDDLADHTTLAQWIGEPLELDLSVLDPPGINQGVARFGVERFLKLHRAASRRVASMAT